MISLASLWMPILVSAVLVFIASSFMHSVLKYHDSDYGPLPDEDLTLSALRGLKIPPGDYCAPRPSSSAARKDPKFLEKVKEGPIVMITVKAGRAMNMGPMLVQWFIYVLIVSTFAAYLASRTLPAGAEYLTAFRVAGFTAFMGYALGQPIESIWYSRKWSSSIKNIVDGLIYGLLTGGVFGWLWPQVVAG
jgi:hypothetical protein